MPAKRRKAQPPTNGNLEQAMALLIQNQAAFMSAFLSHQSRTDERFSHIDERLARIDERFDKIERILKEDRQMLVNLQNAVVGLPEAIRGLPEAIREKIGFKARG